MYSCFQADWLVQEKGFRRVVLNKSRRGRDALESPTKHSRQQDGLIKVFTSVEDIVDYATRNWRDALVITDILEKSDYESLAKRPFLLLIGVDAPLMTRWHRYQDRCSLRDEVPPTLESFVALSDAEFYGLSASTDSTGAVATLGNRAVFHRATVHVLNKQSSLAQFHEHLEELDVLNPDRIRPSWDAYFMQLASLASLRSNCMKRRVGCVLVRNKRVISTGYNGTPRGLKNCNEGGCSRCNSASAGGVNLGTCLCLHAEENALLESGRDRIGDEATLYCNTCPCLTCSVKIAQVGVKEVIYNQAYSMDEQSAAILREAGVILRQYSPPYED